MYASFKNRRNAKLFFQVVPYEMLSKFAMGPNEDLILSNFYVAVVVQNGQIQQKNVRILNFSKISIFIVKSVQRLNIKLQSIFIKIIFVHLDIKSCPFFRIDKNYHTYVVTIDNPARYQKICQKIFQKGLSRNLTQKSVKKSVEKGGFLFPA